MTTMSRSTQHVARIVRKGTLTLMLTFFLFPFSLFLLPIPSVSADTVKFSCWCQDPTERTCNHHLIDSGIDEHDAAWTEAGLTAVVSPVLGAAVLMISGAVAEIQDLLDQPALASRRAALGNLCIERCAADEDSAIHFETSYRSAVCTECNPSVGTSCTESLSGRLAFGKADVKEKVDECEARKAATSLLPVKLAIPLGGVSQVNGLPEYINVAYRYMVTIVLVVAIVMVVYGGFRYLVGATLGDIQAGKKIIQDAIVGMLIVLGAYTILSTINPATTLLSFTPPEPINCQELALPDAIKKSTCDSDAECDAGKRCVLARNIAFDPGAVVDESVEGLKEGGEAGRAADEAGGVLGTEAEGVILIGANLVNAFSPALGASLLLAPTIDEGVAAAGGYEVAGEIAGANIGGATEAAAQLAADLENIRVCSSGEQGSPCAAETTVTSAAVSDQLGTAIEASEANRLCRLGLVCVQSWGMCWPESGNGPGMPCDTNAHCSNGSCVDVEGTTYKVCEIEVRDSTPCFRTNHGNGAVFPITCSGPPTATEFTCAWCPSEEQAAALKQERTWSVVAPGLPVRGQCKPPSALGTPCSR